MPRFLVHAAVAFLFPLLVAGCGTPKAAGPRPDNGNRGDGPAAMVPVPPPAATPGDTAVAISVPDATPPIAPGLPSPDAAPPVEPPAGGSPVETPSACLRTVPISGAPALGPALAAAMPGDCLVVADGAYGDLNVGAKGTAAAGIQIKAANRLKATAGNLHIASAAYVTVEGFALSTILIENSKSARVTRCQVRGPGNGYWVRVELQKGCQNGCTAGPPGTSDGARIDHCDIGGGSSSSDIFNPTGLATNTRIDHNYIHDVTGSHVMTLGCCGAMFDYHDSNAFIEYNLWSKARPTTAEMVSIKSSAAHFRYNTVVNCGGDVDIRAGRHNNIYGNWIFGGGGVRLYEDDHRIYNNYVTSGLQVGPGNAGHAPVKNAIIVFNTFLGGISLSGTGNKFTNNLIVGGGANGPGNLAGAAEALGLTKMGDVFMLTATSKAVGAATDAASFPFVTDDITGVPRGDKPDVGAQQWAMPPGPRRPLTPADVGPDGP
jgi:hypothetical protein